MTDEREVVLVTGASRGIGKGTALALAAAGFDLVLWARSRDDLESVAAECQRYQVTVRVASVDVADDSSVDGAGRASLAGVARLRALILNAGIGVWNPIDRVDLDEWRQIMGTNLDGAFRSLKLALPLLRRHPPGQVVAMGSDSAEYGSPNRSAYCASKWGMRGLIEAVRREVRGEGVRVTYLMPSRVDTFFRGKRPGSRPSTLSIAEVAELITTLLQMPPRLEIREVSFSSIASPFGPFEEVQGGHERAS